MKYVYVCVCLYDNREVVIVGILPYVSLGMERAWVMLREERLAMLTKSLF